MEVESTEMKHLNNEREVKSYTLSSTNRRNKVGFRQTAIVVLLIIMLFIIAAIAYILLSRSNAGRGSICQSEACVHTAKYLYGSMNLTVDPCEDFYNYTCGNWGVHNPRPVNTEYWDVITLVEQKLKKQIMEILQMSGNVPRAVERAQNFYASCTNTGLREENVREAIIKVFKKIGGFPMISKSWDDDEFDWQKAYINIDLYVNSLNLLFDYKVDRQAVEDKKRFIELQVQKNFYIGSTLNDDDSTTEFKDQKLSEFRQSVKNRLVALKATVDWESTDNDINDMIEFEKKLAKIAEESSLANDEDVVTKLTISEMKEQYPNIDWLQLFSNIFKEAKISITDKEIIYNRNPTYFSKLGNVLKETSKRTIANYMAYTVLDEINVKVINNFVNTENNTINTEELRQHCVALTEKFFPVAINYWYIKTVLKQKSMTDLSESLQKIEAALTFSVNISKWMSEKTKQAALLKIHKILDFIASPSSMKSDHELNELYEDIGFVSSVNYAETLKTMSQWIKGGELKLLREEIKNVATPAEVNAYYSGLLLDKIQILSGFLSPPYFYPNAPLAVNVAAIGSTVNHDVIHGFHKEESKYHQKGIKMKWWQKTTRKLNESKVDCFKRQYSNFVEPKSGLHVDGDKTIAGNIADNGAIHETFRAYKMYASAKYPYRDQKLPLQMSRFTMDQLFFIAYANTYCNDHSKQELKNRMLSGGEYPPDVARVMTPLQNSEEFAKAFQCKRGSGMNPEKKCFLW